MTVQLMRGTLHKPDDPGAALYLCEMLAVVCVFVILALGRQRQMNTCWGVLGY